MSNPGDKLSSLFRSLGSDSESFHDTERRIVKNSEQRWPLFKSVSLARAKPTPELSVQDRQLWLKQEKLVEKIRKPALSLSALDEKLTLSLDKISKYVEHDAVQPAVRSEKLNVQSGTKAGSHDQPEQVKLNEVNLPITKSKNKPILNASTSSTSTPPFFKQQVAALNLEVPLRVFERAAALPVLDKRNLTDVNHADDSLQSVFSRIQGQKKVAVKPVEKRSSFFDRLRKR